MKEIADRMFAPVIGFISSLISWEAFSNFLISLIVAFLGGFLAHAGKLLCQRIYRGCSRRYVSRARELEFRQKDRKEPRINFFR